MLSWETRDVNSIHNSNPTYSCAQGIILLLLLFRGESRHLYINTLMLFAASCLETHLSIFNCLVMFLFFFFLK